LTADHRALLHLLGAVKTPREAMREDGVVLEREDFMTAIGDALATACAGLRRAEPRSRLIVLLTDGKSNTGIVQPLEAMQAARQLGFRVYTIGVGTGGRTAFWDTDEAGRRTLRHADADVDHALLEHMATVTGGRYFLAADNDGLLDAMRRIDELEKTPVPVDIHSRYREGYPHLLAAALALLLPATVIRLWLTGSVV
jgi:Ca-activated chloride channel family protein